jgi:hypothetical protein
VILKAVDVMADSILEWLREILTEQDIQDILDLGLAWEPDLVDEKRRRGFTERVSAPYRSGIWEFELEEDDLERLDAFPLVDQWSDSKRHLAQQIYIGTIGIESQNRAADVQYFNSSEFFVRFGEAILRVHDLNVTLRAVRFLDRIAVRDSDLAHFCRYWIGVLLLNASADAWHEMDSVQIMNDECNLYVSEKFVGPRVQHSVDCAKEILALMQPLVERR